MSAVARGIIAVIAAICAVSFAAVALIVPPDAMNRTGLWVMTGICALIVAACLPGRVSRIAGRLLGAIVCGGYLCYIVSQIGKPLPDLAHYRKSDTNLVNAVLGFVVFGIPGGLFAVFGHLPAGRGDSPIDDDRLGEKDI